MITTIQLNHEVKEALNRMKETGKESYEEIILKMMQIIEEQKRKHEELMIEGCKEMEEESLKIAKEFEATEDFRDWEWN